MLLYIIPTTNVPNKSTISEKHSLLCKKHSYQTDSGRGTSNQNTPTSRDNSGSSNTPPTESTSRFSCVCRSSNTSKTKCEPRSPLQFEMELNDSGDHSTNPPRSTARSNVRGRRPLQEISEPESRPVPRYRSRSRKRTRSEEVKEERRRDRLARDREHHNNLRWELENNPCSPNLTPDDTVASEDDLQFVVEDL